MSLVATSCWLHPPKGVLSSAVPCLPHVPQAHPQLFHACPVFQRHTLKGKLTLQRRTQRYNASSNPHLLRATGRARRGSALLQPRCPCSFAPPRTPCAQFRLIPL
eukprot:gene12260-biopygen8500